METFNCMILLFVLLLAIVPFFYGLKKVKVLLFFSFLCQTIKMPKFNDSLAMGITSFYAHFSCLPWELTYILVSIAYACRKSAFLWRMSFQDSNIVKGTFPRQKSWNGMDLFFTYFYENTIIFIRII